MLVICYDEHGGFFDHIPPPAMSYAMPASGEWIDKTPFETLGVRTPGIIVSPLVEPGSSFRGLLDHTSILQFIVDVLGDPADLAQFGDAAARKRRGVLSLAETLTRGDPRHDIPPLPAAPKASGTAATPPISDIGRMFRAVMAARPARLGV